MNLYEQLIRIAYSQIPCMLLNGMSTPVLLLMCSTDYDDKLILMLGFLKSLNARSNFIFCKPALASHFEIGNPNSKSSYADWCTYHLPSPSGCTNHEWSTCKRMSVSKQLPLLAQNIPIRYDFSWLCKWCHKIYDMLFRCLDPLCLDQQKSFLPRLLLNHQFDIGIIVLQLS